MILKIRPRMSPEHTGARQSMLLVRSTGKLRVLKAIYLEELGVALYLQQDSEARQARNPDQGERIPLLMASR